MENPKELLPEEVMQLVDELLPNYKRLVNEKGEIDLQRKANQPEGKDFLTEEEKELIKKRDELNHLFKLSEKDRNEKKIGSLQGELDKPENEHIKNLKFKENLGTEYKNIKSTILEAYPSVLELKEAGNKLTGELAQLNERIEEVEKDKNQVEGTVKTLEEKINRAEKALKALEETGNSGVDGVKEGIKQDKKDLNEKRELLNNYEGNKEKKLVIIAMQKDFADLQEKIKGRHEFFQERETVNKEIGLRMVNGEAATELDPKQNKELEKHFDTRRAKLHKMLKDDGYLEEHPIIEDEHKLPEFPLAADNLETSLATVCSKIFKKEFDISALFEKVILRHRLGFIEDLSKKTEGEERENLAFFMRLGMVLDPNISMYPEKFTNADITDFLNQDYLISRYLEISQVLYLIYKDYTEHETSSSNRKELAVKLMEFIVHEKRKTDSQYELFSKENIKDLTILILAMRNYLFGKNKSDFKSIDPFNVSDILYSIPVSEGEHFDLNKVKLEADEKEVLRKILTYAINLRSKIQVKE